MKQLIISALLLFCTGFAFTQPCGQANAADPERKTWVEIQIARPISLDRLLAMVCGVAGRQCTGTQKLSTEMVVPMTLSGTWNAVLIHLLQGTNVNYASCDSGDGTMSLILSERSSASEVPAPALPASRSTTEQAELSGVPKAPTVPSYRAVAGESDATGRSGASNASLAMKFLPDQAITSVSSDTGMTSSSFLGQSALGILAEKQGQRMSLFEPRANEPAPGRNRQTRYLPLPSGKGWVPVNPSNQPPPLVR